jgi:hypothetical protein
MTSGTRWFLIWLFTSAVMTELLAWLYSLSPWLLTTPWFLQGFALSIGFTSLWACSYRMQAREHPGHKPTS